MTDDLGNDAVTTAMPARDVRCFPAMLSTEAEALSWARAGAKSGSLVVADYQASARGRSGWPWEIEAGRGIGFSVVLRPAITNAREGWGYVAASMALADIVADNATVEWPDTIEQLHKNPAAAVGIQVDPGVELVNWVVVTVLVNEASAPRAALLADCVKSIEHRMAQDPQIVLAHYRERCTTLGRRVRARLIPMSPGGPAIEGDAVDVLDDGALVLLTPRGNRVAIPPQNLGLLEEGGEPPTIPATAKTSTPSSHDGS